MEWNLSAGETAGVVAVGLAMAYGLGKVGGAIEAPKSQHLAMLAGGAAIYTAGVVIGTNRPAQGFLPATTR